LKLENLFHGIPVIEKINWDPHRKIGKITSDSRAIEPGDIFVACPGSRMDGHDFISEAMMAKAGAVVVERPLDLFIPARVCVVRVASTQACLSEILKRSYQNPDQHLKLVGVTGTNGKTTIAYLLQQMLREQANAAYLGTLWYDLGEKRVTAPNTTPGSEILIPLMKQMVDQKVDYCSMEVSSHALEQSRVHGLQFELAMFTQLTQDHLDYHKSMESYFQAKRLFFTSQPQPRQILLNADCPYGRRLLEEIPRAKSYSLDGPADYQAVNVEPSFQGSRFVLRFKGREVSFQIRLPMRHNIANVTTVLAALDLLGYDPEDFRGILAEIHGIPGRLERVSGSGQFQVFVDYAHTPDAIENVLREAKKLKPKRILTLFGCGGDRDRTKRPLMAKAACQYSDIVMLTSDNPRSEDPEGILEDIKKGVSKNSRELQVLEILDRAEAIEKIISLAEPGDAIFILGKGHEDYQIIGDRKIPFDDRLVVQEFLKRKSRVLS
jgi:UDP-N-acetylmuramoyl-L-alanyl-D-glutamate--2,6-diaminopimelate ligase